MVDNEINVEYDRTGVPLPENGEGNYEVELSEYVYPKLEEIPKDDIFTQQEINTYGLIVNNNKINISTTHRLINYLKSFVKSYCKSLVGNVEGDVSNKVDVDDYNSKISEIEGKLGQLEQNVETTQTAVSNVENSIGLKAYPVGSIYICMNNTDPATLFGGTWTKLKDRFLLGSGSKAINATGGEEKHTLTINEMPSHTHVQNIHHHGQDDYEGNKMAFLTLTHETSGMRFALTGRKIGSLPSGDSFIAYTAGDYPATAIRRPYTNSTAASNQYTGGDMSHENMPPYIVVHMWRRIS